jgi:hypothetical protein
VLLEDRLVPVGELRTGGCICRAGKILKPLPLELSISRSAFPLALNIFAQALRVETRAEESGIHNQRLETGRQGPQNSKAQPVQSGLGFTFNGHWHQWSSGYDVSLAR